MDLVEPTKWKPTLAQKEVLEALKEPRAMLLGERERDAGGVDYWMVVRKADGCFDRMFKVNPRTVESLKERGAIRWTDSNYFYEGGD